MNKEYLKHLKKEDPIHYCELMGDPLTGQSPGGDIILCLFEALAIIAIIIVAIIILTNLY